MTVTEQQVAMALSAVIDPADGRNLVEKHMIQGVRIEDGAVLFLIEVDPARGPALEPLRQAAEKAVAALPGVAKVTAVLHAEKGAAAAKKPAPAQKPVLTGVRQVVAVASGKGGVGKSTVALNLALALAETGLKIGLLDADVYGPSVPRLLGLSGRRPETVETPAGRRFVPLEAHGLEVMSVGFMVDESDPTVWRGPMATSALQQMLLLTNWGDLDMLIVDMPPGTGDIQLTLTQQASLAGAVIVSTPQDIALIDAGKGLAMFEKVAVPILGVVENMSWYCCPACGHREEIFGHGGAEAEARRRGVPFLGAVPLVPRIRALSDAGTPVMAAAADSPEADAYRAIARGMLAGLKTAGRAGPLIAVD